MNRRAALTALLVALAAGRFALHAQDHASTRDGVYSESQADRGQASYKTACASCHGAALQGSGAATPPLAGADFLMNWTGQTVGDLFERIQTTMPGDRPGKLSPAENADILAYILKVNKLPAGKADLPTDAAALSQIRFEAPKE